MNTNTESVACPVQSAIPHSSSSKLLPANLSTSRDSGSYTAANEVTQVPEMHQFH